MLIHSSLDDEEVRKKILLEKIEEPAECAGGRQSTNVPKANLCRSDNSETVPKEVNAVQSRNNRKAGRTEREYKTSAKSVIFATKVGTLPKTVGRCILSVGKN